jgi:CRISPR-associated endonuclease/helicase Cas3
MSERDWQSLDEHTEQVVQTAGALAEAIDLVDPLRQPVVLAARWHDAGKAHDVFQRSLRGGDPANGPAGILAKSALKRIRHHRPCFRHELVSGILALMHGQDDLVAYLAAAHHGRVRLSIRSLPHDARFGPSWAGRSEHRGHRDRSIVVTDIGIVTTGIGPRGHPGGGASSEGRMAGA